MKSILISADSKLAHSENKDDEKIIADYFSNLDSEQWNLVKNEIRLSSEQLEIREFTLHIKNGYPYAEPFSFQIIPQPSQQVLIVGTPSKEVDGEESCTLEIIVSELGSIQQQIHKVQSKRSSIVGFATLAKLNILETVKMMPGLDAALKEQMYQGISDVLASKRPYYEIVYQIQKGERKLGYRLLMLLDQTQDTKGFRIIENEVSNYIAFNSESSQSNDLYKTLVERASDGILIVSFEGKYIQGNTAFHEQTGFTREDVQSMNLMRVIEIQEGEPPLRLDELRQNKSMIQERLLRCKDGQLRPFELNSKVLPDQNILVIARDISERKKTEATLKENQELFKRLFEQGADPVLVLGYDGFIDCNQSALDLLGYSKKSDILGKSPEEISPEFQYNRIPSKDLVPIKLQECIEKGNLRFEWIHKKANDESVPVEIVLTSVEFNKQPCFYVIWRDISDRKRAEKELRLKEISIEAALGGIGITDLQGNILYVNRAIADMWGCENKEDLIGKKLTEIFEGNRVYQTIAALQEKGFENGEDIGKRMDGSLFPVEFKANVITDEWGQPTCLFGSFIDITERKEAENKIKNSEVLFRELTENSPSGIILLDRNSRYKFISSSCQRITGFEIDDVINQDPRSFPHPDDVPMIAEKMQHIRSNPGASTTIQYRSRFKDGSYRYLEATYTNLLDLPGVEAITVNFRDIHDLYLAQHKIEESEALHRSIFEYNLDAVLLTDAESKILAANKAACAMFGYSHEDLLSLSTSNLVTELECTKAEVLIRQREEQGSVSGELSFLNSSGAEFLCEVNSSVFKDAMGNKRATLIIKDISERRKAELKQADHFDRIQTLSDLSKMVGHAKSLEEIYKLALQSLKKIVNADHASILLLDEDDVMQFVATEGLSTNYQKICKGHSPWKVSDQNIHPIYVRDVAEEPSLDSLRKTIEVEGIRSLAFIPLMYQNKLLGKFMVYYDRIHDFTDEDGFLMQTVAMDVAWAISETREAQKLQRETEFSNSIINSLPGIFFLVDNDLKLIKWNTRLREVLGYDEEELKSKYFIDFVLPSEYEYAEQHVTDIFNHGYTETELNLVSKNEEILPYLVTAVKVEYQGKNSILGTAIDITQRRKAAEELKKTEERYALAIQATKDGIWDWDLETQVQYFSPRWKEIIGYANDNSPLIASFDFWLSRIHRDHRAMVEIAFKRHLEEGTEFDVEYLHLHRSGDYKWQKAVGQAIYNAQGKPIRMVGSIRDITESKNSERLIVSEKLLSDTVINNLPGIYYLCDEHGHFIRWNKNFEIITGYSESEIKRMHPVDFYEPDKKAILLQRMSEVIDGKVQGIELNLVTKSGQLISFYNNSVSILYEGKRCISEIGIDTSERRKADLELKAFSERFQLFSMASSDAIYDWNLQTNDLWWSMAHFKLFGFDPKLPVPTREEFLTKIHPDDVTVLNQNLIDFAENGLKEWQKEIRFYRKDGSIGTALTRSFAIRKQDGELVRLIGSFVDISERKRLENNLREQQRNEQLKITATALEAQEKERNLIGLELHDNVNQILVGTKLLMSLAYDDPTMRLNLIQSCMNNLQDAINENRKIAHVLVSPDMRKENLIEELKHLGHDMLETAGVRVSILADDFDDKKIDAAKKLAIYRIAQEQCSNILKYAKASEVTIYIEYSESQLKMSISDNGQGMNESNKSTGIGLRNIAARVSVFNGSLSIHSKPGQGFQIVVTIPL